MHELVDITIQILSCRYETPFGTSVVGALWFLVGMLVGVVMLDYWLCYMPHILVCMLSGLILGSLFMHDMTLIDILL